MAQGRPSAGAPGTAQPAIHVKLPVRGVMGTEHPLVCSDCGEAFESSQTRGEEHVCSSCDRERDQERSRSLLERVRQKNRGLFGKHQADREQDSDL